MRELQGGFLIIVLAACAWGCTALGSRGRDRSYAAMEAAGRVPAVARREARLEEPALEESSGVAASRRNPGLFWTHNDSGDGPYLYAFDGRGQRRGVWHVTGARAEDWEDMAAGPGPEPGRAYLYVGDIGDNDRSRAYVTVYRVPEPQVVPDDARSTRRRPRATEPAEAIRFKYPDGRHNAEALLVHPSTGDIYVVVKSGEPGCGVYRLRAAQVTAGVNTLERVGEFRSPSPLGSLVTGGAISPDGRRVVLCDYLSAYELRLPEATPAPFESVWRQTPAVIQVGPRRQGEAVCYRLDGLALALTSEGYPAMFYEVELKAVVSSQ
ncbi:MAG TPA: hypothetical protein VG148_10590 [Pyrinomonadaceae bacterium]|nr:hypothetical protein [Pyrinomonadaceae bacterium]